MGTTPFTPDLDDSPNTAKMVAPTASEPRTNNNGHRLYVKGKHVAFKRGKHTLRPGTSLIKIEGVDDPQAAHFYLGKRIAYVYRGKKEIRGTKIRVIWGKVARPHGNSGVVRAHFKHNLPPKSLGGMVRVMLYPSSIQTTHRRAYDAAEGDSAARSDVAQGAPSRLTICLLSGS